MQSVTNFDPRRGKRLLRRLRPAYIVLGRSRCRAVTYILFCGIEPRSSEIMSEQSGKQAAEKLLNTFLETFGDSIQKQNSSIFYESDKTSVSSSIKRLFGREKPVHHLLGGGKSADILLWRNKRISGSVLASSTVIWLLFEWLNYHLLTLISFALVLCMSIVFLWSNVAVAINRTPPQIPRIALPEDLFVNAAVALRYEINRFLGFLQDVSSGRNLKNFLVVVAGLWFLAIVGSWCNFLTILYIGFVGAHTLPVLYERYEDQVDSFLFNAMDEFKRHYGKFDSRVLSKIPKGPVKGRKSE